MIGLAPNPLAVFPDLPHRHLGASIRRNRNKHMFTPVIASAEKANNKNLVG